MLYFIDTNIFLRVLVKENSRSFTECSRIFSLIRDGQIKALSSSLILAEVNWVLSSFYKFNKSDVLIALEGILSLKNLLIEDKIDSRQALDLFKGLNVKFIDALIASNSLFFNKGAVIISYDKDFDKLGIIRKEPREIK